MKNWFFAFALCFSVVLFACESEEPTVEEEVHDQEYENLKEDVLNEANEMYSDSTTEVDSVTNGTEVGE